MQARDNFSNAATHLVGVFGSLNIADSDAMQKKKKNGRIWNQLTRDFVAEVTSALGGVSRHSAT